MDFSTMTTQEVRERARCVVEALNASGEYAEAYYRMPHDRAPIVYATVTRGILEGRSVVIREYHVERLAERLQAS